MAKFVKHTEVADNTNEEKHTQELEHINEVNQITQHKNDHLGVESKN